MRRRDLLAALPTLFAGSLSGCLATAGSDTPTSETTTEQLPPSGYGSLSKFDAGDPFETRRVGASAEESHHRAAVWNDDAERLPGFDPVGAAVRLAELVDLAGDPLSEAVETGEPTRTKWYNDENMIVEAANELGLETLLPTHWDMWKGMTTEPTVLHNHARSFAYPERIEIAEIGDRVDL